MKDPCGYGVIIINTFYGIYGQQREGTENELKMFKQLFESVGLETIIFQELEKHQIMTELETITGDEKLKQHSMIALAIRYISLCCLLY